MTIVFKVWTVDAADIVIGKVELSSSSVIQQFMVIFLIASVVDIIMYRLLKVGQRRGVEKGDDRDQGRGREGRDGQWQIQ